MYVVQGVTLKLFNISISKGPSGKPAIEAFPQTNFVQKVFFLLVLIGLWGIHTFCKVFHLSNFWDIDFGDLAHSLLDGNVGIQFAEDSLVANMRAWKQSFLVEPSKVVEDSKADQCHQAWWLDSMNAIFQSFWMKGWFVSRRIEQGFVEAGCRYFTPFTTDTGISFREMSGSYQAFRFTLLIFFYFVARHLEKLLPKNVYKSILSQRLSQLDFSQVVGVDGLEDSMTQLKVSFWMGQIFPGERGLFYPKAPDESFHAMWTQNPLGSIMLGMYICGWPFPHYAAIQLVDSNGEIVDHSIPLTSEQMRDKYKGELGHITTILGCKPSEVQFTT